MPTKQKSTRRCPDAKEMRNYLKSWPVHFEGVLDGSKTFEARKNDRDFKVGDLIELQEWKPNDSRFAGEYTGRTAWVRVTSILHGSEESPLYGIGPGFCVMSIKLV